MEVIMQGNKKLKLLAILLPLAVIVPLLAVSWLIGPGSIWLWAGVGLGMAVVWWMNREKGTRHDEVAK